MWHGTHDIWHIVFDEHALKISALYLFRFGIDSIWKIFELKDRWVSHSINKWTGVIVEQPLLHRVCQISQAGFYPSVSPCESGEVLWLQG